MLQKIKDKVIHNRVISELLGLILLVLIGWLIYNAVTPSRVDADNVKEGYVHFENNGNRIKERLTSEEIEQICGLFSDKVLQNEGCECGGSFSGKYKIVLDDEEFWISDLCGDMIYCCDEDKYFMMSDEEWEQLKEILNNHGFAVIK